MVPAAPSTAIKAALKEAGQSAASCPLQPSTAANTFRCNPLPGSGGMILKRLALESPG
jgi:hypothetical protein